MYTNNMCVHINICTFIYTCRYIYMYKYIYVHVYMYIQTCRIHKTHGYIYRSMDSVDLYGTNLHCHQWLCLLPVKGGRWRHIIPQLAGKMPLIVLAEPGGPHMLPIPPFTGTLKIHWPLSLNKKWNFLSEAQGGSAALSPYPFNAYKYDITLGKSNLNKGHHIEMEIFLEWKGLSSRELTYATMGKGTSSSRVSW